MTRKFQLLALSTLCLTALLASPLSQAQTSNETSNATPSANSNIVPRLVRFAGVAKDADNKNLTGAVGITFLLYKDQQGGAPLWMETQNVQADSTGHYSVQLGATKPDGLPTDVFTSGEARWLTVQISGQAEQPRVLLLSVPYALKAADAETIGGLPPSAFMKVQPADQAGANADGTISAASATAPTAAGDSAHPFAAADVTTTGGVKNDIPLWTTSKNIQSSIISQTAKTQINVAGSAAVDSGNTNTGTLTPGLRFGNSISGEAISSARTGSTNVFGIDFYTGNTRQISITNSGDLGIGTATPAGALHSVGPASAPPSSQPAANNGLVLGTNGTSSYKWVQSFGGPLVLNPTGNIVGIGTASPNSTNELQVQTSLLTSIFGQSVSESKTGSGLASADSIVGVGVWGDGGAGFPSTRAVGIVGTVDNGNAAIFANNSSSDWTTVLITSASSADPLRVVGPSGNCSFDSSGDLTCTGNITPGVVVDSGARTVAMPAIGSPVNWFEDAGSAQLVNGAAVVNLDPKFIQTVNTKMEYKVFPVPNGDCKGLYVTNKTATSFEVRELGSGTSNVAFDYRIMALRRNYENVRFADVTRSTNKRELMPEGAKTMPAKAAR
ncbi:MAG: hypothetical protein WBS24_19210 [Terriglobales bacterium]